MFKSILPSKRVSSSDFTMVTPLGETDINGKENMFNSSKAKPSIASTRGFPTVSDKRKKASAKGKSNVADDESDMIQAFDKLLVSPNPCIVVDSSKCYNRMTYKSRRLRGRNCTRWMHQSRLKC